MRIRSERLADRVLVSVDHSRFNRANTRNHRQSSHDEKRKTQNNLRSLHLILLTFWWKSIGAAAIKPLPSRYVLLLLPIAQGSRAHWTKTTELLNFDVFGASGL
jgi:hypothetical protein